MQIFARIWFGTTAALSLAGIIIGIVLVAPNSAAERVATLGGEGARVSDFTAWWERIITMFSYFTVQSNVIVIVTCAMLAIRLNRTSPAFRTWRLTGIGAITITGLVYNLILLPMTEVKPTGWSLVQNDLLHVVTPIMVVVGWLIFGPRIKFRWMYVWFSMIWGVAWITYTLVRGAIYNWYPYPFLNVYENGYPRSLIDIFVIAVIYILFAIAVMGIDQKLPNVLKISRKDRLDEPHQVEHTADAS